MNDPVRQRLCRRLNWRYVAAEFAGPVRIAPIEADDAAGSPTSPAVRRLQSIDDRSCAVAVGPPVGRGHRPGRVRRLGEGSSDPRPRGGSGAGGRSRSGVRDGGARGPFGRCGRRSPRRTRKALACSRSLSRDLARPPATSPDRTACARFPEDPVRRPRAGLTRLPADAALGGTASTGAPAPVTSATPPPGRGTTGTEAARSPWRQAAWCGAPARPSASSAPRAAHGRSR